MRPQVMTHPDNPRVWYGPGRRVGEHDMVLRPAGLTSSVLVFLHSYGQGPEDVLHYLPYLVNGQDLQLRIVAPCAPRRDGYCSWFDYGEELDTAASEEQLVEQRTRVLAIIWREWNHLRPGGRIMLGGLSQGASLAADALLHADSPLPVAGVFLSRGGVLRSSARAAESLQPGSVTRRSTWPLLIYHGLQDEAVPWEHARTSYRALQSVGAEISTLTDGANHGTESWTEYAGVREFVQRCLTDPDTQHAGAS